MNQPNDPPALNHHDWHRRPKHAKGPCPICGAPPAGTIAQGRYHRAVNEGEGIPFRYMIRFRDFIGQGRKKNTQPRGWKHKGVCPVPPVPPSNALPSPSASTLPTEPGQTTLALITRAALLATIGKSDVAIQKAMNLAKGTLARWQREWPEYWHAGCESAAETLLKKVREQMGTAAILDDPDGWMQEAEAADRIATDRGESLLPAPAQPTLTTFFETYYRPNRLFDASAGALKNYRIAMKFWRLITGDPPLEEITIETLSLFRGAISKRRGRRPHLPASTSTVHSKLQLVQTVLDLAGPAGRGHRDAAGILKSTPWLRPPKVILKTPREIPADVLQQIHLATAGMDAPWFDGIKPPAWWRALLVTAYNTQLRRRTLFEMRMDEIDWPNHRIILPAERMKAGRPMIVHLNATALKYLQDIRTNRELIFPWPMNQRTFDRYFHRLQASIGLPKDEWFGLHTIRATSATVLAGFSPQASQLALGHTQLAVTVNHYIRSDGIVAAALDAMPQPWE